MAHMATASKCRVSFWLLLSFLAFAMPLFAQESAEGARQVWKVTPSASLKETLTNNVALTSANPDSELISELSPGITVANQSSRASAYLNYQLHALDYAKNSRPDSIQHALNTFGSIGLSGDWLFLDFSGEVAQQTISAFGTQSGSDTSLSSNRTQTSSYRVSPYIRGQLFGSSDYAVRHLESTTFSKSNAASNVRNSETSVALKGLVMSPLAWIINANRRQDQFENGAASTLEKLRGQLSYRYENELQLSANAGRESNNYASLGMSGVSTSGYDIRWTPGPRTEMSVGNEKRFFGNARNVTFAHRTPKTVWRYEEVKDISVVPNQFASVGLGNIYDLMFSQMSSLQPDPVLRAQAVNEYLQANGISADTPVTAGFLSSRVTLQQQRSLSFVLSGARSSLTLMAKETKSRALTSAAAGVSDDFSTASEIRLRGLSGTITHQLTPFSTLTLTGKREQNTATAGAFQQTTLWTGDLGLASRFTHRLSATFALRRNIFTGTFASYRENVASGALSLTF